MSTTNSDVLSRIHCGYEQLKAFNRAKSDGDLKPERRVRFPDDEVISDYLEPFRPVPDNCTSEELITAYIDSCLHYKVQPIEFLLEQLKGIDLSICNERYSRLSLKGVRLSRLQVETLEEIFRRVHFRELDFENTCLDDQSAVALFDMLLHYETCNELSITLNLDRFHSSQAWARCVTFLRRSSELRKFALTNTPLSIDNFLGMSFFGLSLNCLSLRNCCLSGQTLYGLVRWLRLLLSSASLDPPNREKIGDGVRTGKRSAHVNSRNTRRSRLANSADKPANDVTHSPIWNLKLDVACNKLSASDAETMLALIRHQLLVPDLQTHRLEKSEETRKEYLPVGGIGFLEHLDISNNQIGDDGLRIISTGLLQSYRTRLRLLNSASGAVTGEEVDDDAFVSCSTGDSRQTPLSSSPDKITFRVRGLEHLSVANNGLTASGMQSIALVLMQTPSSLVSIVGGLVSLDLSHNPNIRDAGVEMLCDGLMRNHSLKMLYLKAVNMSFSGIFALSGFLTESNCLHYLDIRMNPMNLASLMALSKTLMLNHTLLSLLSDARKLASSTDPLIASDAELTLVLLDEIDSCLRRNRILTEASYNLSSNATALHVDTHPPSSTCMHAVPLTASPRHHDAHSAPAGLNEGEQVKERLELTHSTENATAFPPHHLAGSERNAALDSTLDEESSVEYSVFYSPKETSGSPDELVSREAGRVGHPDNLRVPCTLIEIPSESHLSASPDQSTDLLSVVSAAEPNSCIIVNPSVSSNPSETDISTCNHSPLFDTGSFETPHTQKSAADPVPSADSCSSSSDALVSSRIEEIKRYGPRKSRSTRKRSTGVKNTDPTVSSSFVP